jgi:hypothetical protein
MQKQDSIASESVAEAAATSAAQPSYPTSPYQVLRMLPRDATPAQQDSAIQAWFHPSEIRYSERPDTLHLPGQEPAKSLNEVEIPQYYRKNFFSTTDTLFYTEHEGVRFGVAGDPKPYTLRQDNFFTSVLLLCLVVFVISIAHSQHFITQQLRNFFYISHNVSNLTETIGEIHFQLFFIGLQCLILSLACYQYTIHLVTTLILDSESKLVIFFFLIFIGFYVIKWILYQMVNSIFFTRIQRIQWNKTFLFIQVFTCVLIFPFVLLVVYFNLSLQNATYYFIFVLIFTKILAFYKQWSIFFHSKSSLLQFFLYFCTLEIVPLLSLAGGLMVLIDKLKLNF